MTDITITITPSTKERFDNAAFSLGISSEKLAQELIETAAELCPVEPVGLDNFWKRIDKLLTGMGYHRKHARWWSANTDPDGAAL